MSARQMDLQTLGQTLAAVQSIGDLIVTRQRWVFSHPRFDALDPEVKENIKGLLLGVAGTIRDGLDPQRLNLDALADQPLRSWLAELDQRVAPHLAQLYTQMDLMGVPQPAYEVKGERDGKATVEMSVAETKLPMQFVSVDGFWVPADLAEDTWKEKMTQWEQSIGESAGGPQTAMMALTMVPALLESNIQPALAAESARDFHAVMDGWFTAAAPWVAQLSNLNPLAGRRPGYGSGYGSGYGEMMEMEGEMMEGNMMEMEGEMMEMEMEAGMEREMMETEGMQER